jgi:hypothetical protein
MGGNSPLGFEGVFREKIRIVDTPLLGVKH